MLFVNKLFTLGGLHTSSPVPLRILIQSDSSTPCETSVSCEKLNNSFSDINRPLAVGLIPIKLSGDHNASFTWSPLLGANEASPRTQVKCDSLVAFS